MKKLFAALLVLCLLAASLTLMGCGVDKEEYEAVTAEAEALRAKIAEDTAALEKVKKQSDDYVVQIDVLNGTAKEAQQKLESAQALYDAEHSASLEKAIEALQPLMPKTYQIREVYPQPGMKCLQIVAVLSNEEEAAFNFEDLYTFFYEIDSLDWWDYDWIYFDTLWSKTDERWYSVAIRCSDKATQEIKPESGDKKLWEDLS